MTQKSDSPEPKEPGREGAEGGAGDPQAAADPAELRGALEAAEAKAAENWDKYVRASAELENLRRRAARDVENAHRYGAEKLASGMLEIKDSLERGLEAVSETADLETLREGKAATLKLLEQTLEKFGVTEIDPEGEPFDPELHEAMSMQESTELEPGSVMMVVQKGYRLHDRLLRPARVIVSREPGAGVGEERHQSGESA